LSIAIPPEPPERGGDRLRRARTAIGRYCRESMAVVIRIATDRTLPLLILMAVGAAFFAMFINAPHEIVLGILFIGVFTAVLEIRMHNDK
jgi:hypothetical protein